MAKRVSMLFHKNGDIVNGLPGLIKKHEEHPEYRREAAYIITPNEMLWLKLAVDEYMDHKEDCKSIQDTVFTPCACSCGYKKALDKISTTLKEAEVMHNKDCDHNHDTYGPLPEHTQQPIPDIILDLDKVSESIDKRICKTCGQKLPPIKCEKCNDTGIIVITVRADKTIGWHTENCDCGAMPPRAMFKYKEAKG